ncbi:hypothetical protein IV102_25560 [bacterium]|nr:hypothetical protein [bacterium]
MGASTLDSRRDALLAALLDGDAGQLPSSDTLSVLLKQLTDHGRVEIPSEPENILQQWIRVLASAGAVLDWADQASARAEARVAARLELAEHGLGQLESCEPAIPILEPWLYLEWARLEAFRGRNLRAQERATQVLRHRLATRFPGVIQRTLELLRSMDEPEYRLEELERPYRPSTLANWQRLVKVLAPVPKLLQETCEEKIKQSCVLFLADLLEPHQVFWLEQISTDLEWEAIAYQGPPGFGLFSSNLLMQALEHGELVTEPQQSTPYESLILSEARGVIIVVLPGKKAAIYLSHREFLGRYQAEDLGVLRLVAQLAASHFETQLVHRQRLEADRETLRRRQLLGQIHEEIGLGLAWLDSQGMAHGANPAYLQHHKRGELPIWEQLWGPDQSRARSWFSEALRSSGIQSELFRCPGDGLVLWQAYYLDGEPESGHRLCVVQDLTGHHWEESVTLLERERHWLSGDLHDGPAQLAAAEALRGQPGALALIRELIDWLRSPLYTDDFPSASFSKLVEYHLPEVTFDWSCPLDDWSPRLLVCYRVLQDVLEKVSDRPAEPGVGLTITIQDVWRVCLEGVDCAEYQPSPSIHQRLELFQGELQRSQGKLTWTLG